ncbi:ABC transporter substrate-binding protein [Blastococcus sp. URHD0036]|uniref:ABC transporter substrate-binding protein n=1 Tax=Blastococcus sp. URHD0036 TaxID=1380356 RepID=UPI000A440D81|nr:ABC transporter substrate-binding protein [Blastococcus sp. URHD0036]
MLGRKSARLAAAGVAMALALSACGGSDGDSGNAGGSGSGGTLTLGSIVAPPSLAAAESSWANGSPYVQAVYDSLLRQAPDGSVEPWLATEWSYDDARTVLTMTLRDDVTFTDGTPFTADVAAQNVLRFRDGTSAQASKLANVADATAVDDTTLQITLTAPDPGLLTYLAQAGGAQASPASFDAAEAATAPVGSGPYVLDADRTVIGSTYVFTKNPEYWAPDEQHYDELVINVFTTAQTQVNAIQGGQVDATNLIDNQSGPQIEGAGYTIQTVELNWAGLILFDRAGQLNPALGDVRVRQAIAHAIDRDALLEGAAGGLGTVTGQVFREGSDAYDPELDDRYDYDPDAARDLLAEAGYPDGFTLEMPFFDIGLDPAFDLTAQYLSDVGITVEYTTIALADAFTQVLGGSFPATLFYLSEDSTTWQTAQVSIAQGSTFNVFHQPDETVAGLLSTIQTGSEDEAAAAATELNEYVVEQAWFVPYYRAQLGFASGPDTDVVLQSDNAYPLLQNITPAA